MDKILKIAVKKCKQTGNGKEYGGYLTAKEILCIADLEVKPNHPAVKEYWYKQIEDAKTNKRAGKANPNWFYFQPSRKFDVLKGGLL